jgi:hypothetical protein
MNLHVLGEGGDVGVDGLGLFCGWFHGWRRWPQSMTCENRSDVLDWSTTKA